MWDWIFHDRNVNSIGISAYAYSNLNYLTFDGWVSSIPSLSCRISSYDSNLYTITRCVLLLRTVGTILTAAFRGNNLQAVTLVTLDRFRIHITCFYRVLTFLSLLASMSHQGLIPWGLFFPSQSIKDRYVCQVIAFVHNNRELCTNAFNTVYYDYTMFNPSVLSQHSGITCSWTTPLACQCTIQCKSQYRC